MSSHTQGWISEFSQVSARQQQTRAKALLIEFR